MHVLSDDNDDAGGEVDCNDDDDDDVDGPMAMTVILIYHQFNCIHQLQLQHETVSRWVEAAFKLLTDNTPVALQIDEINLVIHTNMFRALYRHNHTCYHTD